MTTTTPCPLSILTSTNTVTTTLTTPLTLPCGFRSLSSFTPFTSIPLSTAIPSAQAPPTLNLVPPGQCPIARQTLTETVTATETNFVVGSCSSIPAFRTREENGGEGEGGGQEGWAEAGWVEITRTLNTEGEGEDLTVLPTPTPTSTPTPTKMMKGDDGDGGPEETDRLHNAAMAGSGTARAALGAVVVAALLVVGLGVLEIEWRMRGVVA